MRMTASWSGSNDPTVYKSVARRCAPMASSPRILNRQTDRHRPDAEAMQKAPVAVHRRSACSGVKALRNTSNARRQAAKLCYRFGPLTPSARSGNLIAGDGTKNGLSRSEQKTVSTTQNNRLTGKAPYKFESPSLHQRVCGRGYLQRLVCSRLSHTDQGFRRVGKLTAPEIVVGPDQGDAVPEPSPVRIYKGKAQMNRRARGARQFDAFLPVIAVVRVVVGDVNKSHGRGGRVEERQKVNLKWPHE